MVHEGVQRHDKRISNNKEPKINIPSKKSKDTLGEPSTQK